MLFKAVVFMITKKFRSRQINKIHLDETSIILDAIHRMRLMDVAVVTLKSKVYLCYKESNTNLRIWESSALFIDNRGVS